MAEIFETDIGKLKQLSLRSSNPQALKQVHNDESIRRELHRRTLLKFAMLCRKLNVDPMHAKSIHVALLLFSKIKNKQKLLDGFLSHPCCQNSKPIHIDWRALSDGDVNLNEVFCAMSDWILILGYLTPAIDPALSDALSKETLLVRLRKSWSVGGLDQYYPATVERLMTVFTFMAPYNLSATKMLERLLVGEGDTCRDLEFRCLRMTNNFMDVSVDESESLVNMLQIVPCMMTKPSFFTDMKIVLAKEESMTGEHANNQKQTRLQMRYVTKNAANVTNSEYKESFETWLGQQKFTVTMSRHLQLLLYFIQVQVKPIPRESYVMHFTENMLSRLQTVSVQSIDVDAVITIIKSLRVYHHNVKDLLDFRSTCLAGFNQHIRNNLSLAQILQLYVCSFQHPSIQQQCWKVVVPVWTHTTASAVRKFTTTHEFDYAPVIDSVVQCQVQDSV